MSVSGPNGYRYCLFPSLCVCTNTEETEQVQLLLVTHEHLSDALHSTHLVPPSASTERVGEQASEIAVHRATLARVCGRSGFWGAYSRLLASSARPMLIQFFVVGVVRVTALRTSVCIDCVRLHRTYTRDVSYEWSH
jgi:hypothetical protein